MLRARTCLKQNVRRLASEQQQPTMAEETWRMLKVLLPTGAAIYGGYFFFTVPVVGRSMSPQFNPRFADYGDTAVYVPRLMKSLPLVRGCVYLFDSPNKAADALLEGETPYLIKRCIAIEGDTVIFQKDDKVVEQEIPPGHAWLESDNHNFQSGQQPDSLRFGPVPFESVWGRVVHCVRQNNLFETVVPYPQNYDWNVKVIRALPHQRLRFDRNVPNLEMKAIRDYKNLANKKDMTLVPKGPADLALGTMTDEEKQGFVNRHDFVLESDKVSLEKLQNAKNEEVDQINRSKMIPGTPITAPSKPANQTQYPNLN